MNMFFSTYQDETVYQELGEDEELLGFSKDQDKERLMLLTRYGSKPSEANIEPRSF
jgi:hypothetical protein